MTLVQACLNGTRTRADHPAVPLTAAELAADARACAVEAVHVHPRDDDGRETLAAEACGEAVRALRDAGVEVSLSTGAWIEPDPERRAALVRGWGGVAPDVASVNVSEDGWEMVADALRDIGAEVEAGLAGVADAETWLVSRARDWTRRVLVEVPDREPAAAVEHARAIARLVTPVGLPVLVHGEGAATWAVVADGRSHRMAVRVGLEDVLVLPDGTPARDNAALVRALTALPLGHERR